MIKIVGILTIIMNEEKQPSEMQKRLFDLCDALEISRRQFSMNIGRSAAYVGNLKDDITVDVVNKILAIYPQVSMTWLVTGKGNMFVKEPLTEDLSSYIMQENKELKKENKELYAEIVLLRDKLSAMEIKYAQVGVAAESESVPYYRILKKNDKDKNEE